MRWCQVAVIATFVVLLQCNVYQAASCKGRKIVIQIKIPGNTNVNVKFPPKSDPVKFVPYPYGQYKNNSDCFICNGPFCRKCTVTENEGPSSTPSQSKTPQRTNIVIDLRRTKSNAPNEADNNNSGDKTTPSTGNGNTATGATLEQDQTVVELQDSSLATSVSNSAVSNVNNNGDEAATSSASVSAISNTDVIASFDQNSPASNTENIYVEDETQSIADSFAASDVESKSQPVPIPVPEPDPVPIPISNPTSKNAATSITFSKAEDNGNSNESAESVGAANANTSSNGKNATSTAESISAADATNNGAGDSEATALTADKAKATTGNGGQSGDGSDATAASIAGAQAKSN